MGKRLGLALAVFRARHGKISQKRLAESSGLTQKALSRLEMGKAKGVDFATIERLGTYFGCHPRDLIDYVEFPASGRFDEETPYQPTKITVGSRSGLGKSNRQGRKSP